MSDNKKMIPKNTDVKNITDEVLESVNGGASQNIPITCKSCNSHFWADVSGKMVVFCPNCGAPAYFFV